MTDDLAWTLHRSEHGYGWHYWIGSRIRIASGRALTPMRPRVYRSGDEFCNDVLALHLWPLGGVDVWWRRNQRTAEDGLCDKCTADFAELAELGWFAS